MSLNHGIKQLEERNVASEIILMVWSDRMDLVALSNVKGEVALHRLTWTKAWSLSPPKEGLAVKGIAWRPDGKIIAVAYSSGEVSLVKVENKKILHSIEIKGDISCIYWMQEKPIIRSKTTPLTVDGNEQNNYMKYIDFSSKFLPEIQSQTLDNSTGSIDETHKSSILQEQTRFNLLLIGTKESHVYVSIFGCFPCTTLDLNSYLGHKCSIENMHLTEDLSKMFISVRDADNNIKIFFIDSSIFKTHTKELFAIALKRIKLTSLINYLSSMITAITETWESILLEMDNKLSKYASKVAEGGVTADFLDLLMFGMCSDEMKEFLVHDLTKKGLEKFGQTIEMSYSSIQKLLLKYVMRFGQNITYHLAELRGMARLEHRYKILGLSEEAINDAIQSNGAFLIKSGEMQQIISHSITNYKAFFRWLYTAIMHLMEEPIPNDIPKMTQQDLAYITEFLQNFDHIGRKTSGQSGFIMERLGQYLNDAPLKIPPNMSGNDWTQFLSQNHCVQNHPSVLKHFEDMSLVQQFNHLKTGVENIFTMPRDLINQQFKVVNVLNCFQFSSHGLKMSQVNVNQESVLFAFLHPLEKVHMLQLHISENNSCFARSGDIYFPRFTSATHHNFDNNNQIVDVKFYSNNILSLLVQENSFTKITVLHQIPLPPAIDKFVGIENMQDEIFKEHVPKIDASELMPRLSKNVEGMTASQFAVSGSRKVGIVLSENRRKIRLFEMEGEEEEDEDADMTSSTVRESDMSLQDISTVQ